jgi:hypothetical protein
MFTTEVRVGRLVEIRMVAPVTIKDIDEMQAHLFEIYARYPSVVIVADYSRATTFSQEVADKVLNMYRSAKGHSERSAALVSQSAVFSLQIERLITQAANPIRRSFRDPFELRAFLGAVLTHEEHLRLVQFLSEEP